MVAREYSQFFAFGVIALVMFAAGCSLDQPVAKKSENDSRVRVKTVSAVQTELAKTTQQPATVLAFFETEIRCKVSGFVTEVAADIGDYVQAGQTLAQIDIPEMQQQRKIIESRIDLLTAEEQGASAGVGPRPPGVEASVAAAEAEFNRTSDLVQRGSLQSRVLDEVRKKRDSEAAAKEAAKSAVESAEAEVAVAEAQKAAAVAKLRTAEARTQVTRNELAELDVMLAYTTVKAPFEGMVTQRHVDLGDLIDGKIGEGSEPLFVLSEIDKVRVHIPVPEVDAPFIQPGDSITLTFPSFATEPPISTTVTRVSGSLDPSTRTMKVEVELENQGRKLLPGMFGEAVIDMETKVAASMLPSRAVRFDESGNAYVYLLADDSKVSITEITTGIDTGTEIEILAGLEAGQTVIDSHLKRFTDGQVVQPL